MRACQQLLNNILSSLGILQVPVPASLCRTLLHSNGHSHLTPVPALGHPVGHNSGLLSL